MLKQRKRNRKEKLCFSFRKNGSCQYGDACKFKHIVPGLLGMSEAFNTEDLNITGFYFPVDHNGEEIYRSRSPEERYFEHLFLASVSTRRKKEFEDMCVQVHSNGICLLTLSPFHAALNISRRKVTKIEFTIKGKHDMTGFKVSGKRKIGGIFLEESCNLCTISCDDGFQYLIKAPIRAKLYEVNTKLVENPEKLYCPSEGYIVVAKPDNEELNQMRTKLMNKTAYSSLRRERNKSK